MVICRGEKLILSLWCRNSLRGAQEGDRQALGERGARDVMGELGGAEAGAGRSSAPRRRSASRSGNTKSPATTPGQGTGVTCHPSALQL